MPFVIGGLGLGLLLAALARNAGAENSQSFAVVPGAMKWSDGQEAGFRASLPAHGRWMADAIVTSSRRHDVTPYLPAAIAAWESDYGYGPGYTPRGDPAGVGDKGHGHTPWQLDDHPAAGNSAFLSSSQVGDINASTEWAFAHHLVPAIKHFGLNDALAVASVVAAYNAGIGRVDAARKSGALPGSVTTATPYGSYVDAVSAQAMKLLDRTV